jgi:hypothetical protein
MAARREGAELGAAEQASLTQLRRYELQAAQMTPLGPIGALSELNTLQKQIRDEIQALQVVLQNTYEGDEKGRIQANGIRSEIASLRVEEKQHAMALNSAILDSVLQAAMGSVGRFEKIIITRDQNLARGLQMGIINAPAPFVGSIGPSHNRQPIHIQDVLGLDQGSLDKATSESSQQGASRKKSVVTGKPQNYLEAVDKILLAVKELKNFVPEEPEGVEVSRPTVSGGRAIL